MFTLVKILLNNQLKQQENNEILNFKKSICVKEEIDKEKNKIKKSKKRYDPMHISKFYVPDIEITYTVHDIFVLSNNSNCKATTGDNQFLYLYI